VAKQLSPSHFSKTLDKSWALKEIIEHTLDDKSAVDVKIIDLIGKSDMADYMIIATGTSTTHVATLAEYVLRAFKESGISPLASEGMRQRDWVLVDNPYIIVHLFRPEVREYYNLEKMWETDFSSLETVY